VSDTEANRTLIRLAFEGWRDGHGHVGDLFAPDMTWRVEGNNLAAKDYTSTKQFVDEVLAPFAARFPTDAPFRPVAIRSVHADGDTVIVVWDGRGVANDGVAYENSYAWFLQLREGKIVDGVAFFDSVAFDDLWKRVPPRR
jgi:ketosteroid isomerase-like protein